MKDSICTEAEGNRSSFVLISQGIACRLRLPRCRLPGGHGFAFLQVVPIFLTMKKTLFCGASLHPDNALSLLKMSKFRPCQFPLSGPLSQNRIPNEISLSLCLMAASFLLQKAAKGRRPEHSSQVLNPAYDISREARPEQL